MFHNTPRMKKSIAVSGLAMTFGAPCMDTAKASENAVINGGKVIAQRENYAFLPDGPESPTRFVNTIRGVERQITSTSTEDLDSESGEFQNIRWWVASSPIR